MYFYLLGTIAEAIHKYIKKKDGQVKAFNF